MSIKVDVISGFLGAGKTTLIKKMFNAGFNNEKVVLIENEFGEIGIDGSFLKDSGVEIKEINSGCICCSLVGDFKTSMEEIVNTYNPDRIVIEPSGVGKLSDIINAVEKLDIDLELNIVATVVDGGKCKLYMKNFGEFFNNQVEDARTIVISKAEKLTEEKIVEAYQLIQQVNPHATILIANLTIVDPLKMLEALERKNCFEQNVKEEFESDCCCHHGHGCCHHDHEDHDHECGCHHDHEDHDHECGCHHDHEDHDHECGCHHDHEDHDHECCHHDHEDHDHECCHHDHEDHDHECECHHDHEDHDHECGCHHDHGHDADEIFTSIGVETVNAYSESELNHILESLKDESKYGAVLRSKGIVRDSLSSDWLHFDYVSGDYEIRHGESDFMGRIVVIGSMLKEEEIKKLVLKK